MIRKGLYLSNIDPQQSIGYIPKILGQVQGFRQLGYDMDLICFNQNSQVVLTSFHQQTDQLQESNVIAQGSSNLLVRRLRLLRAAIKHISDTRPKFLYLRYPRSEPLYVYFLAKIRSQFPKLIILSEFPTYPYDKEYEGKLKLKDRLVFFLDKVTRQYLKHFINRVVAINYDQHIFGIETISIDNGINISDYKHTKNSLASPDPINIIGVANVSPWHGYDRLIRGLGKYYRQSSDPHRKIIFHIVGAQAPYLNELVMLASQEESADYVIFHEPTQGKELDSLFIGCQLAIGVLGGHRKGLELMSPLKNREYCARGIPFIFSHSDPDFPAGFQYSLHVNSSDNPIDVSQLIDFIEKIKEENDVAKNMRNYASRTLSWATKLDPVKSYIDDFVY